MLTDAELRLATVILKAVTMHLTKNGVSLKRGLLILRRVVEFYEDKLNAS